VYYRVLVTRQDVPPEFTDALVEHFLTGPHPTSVQEDQ
jgi:hypothetical protein